MHPEELTARARTAAQAAVQAGDALRKLPIPAQAGGVEVKAAHDFVTQADRDTEALLIALLSAAYPEDGFLGEESAERQSKGGGRWIIDPIDGTTNFIKGIPYYSISIAYEWEGQLQLGVVFQPATDDLFVAVRGMGAHHNGQPIHVSSCDQPHEAVLGTSFAHRTPDVCQRNMRLLQGMLQHISDFRRMGSAALDLCYVACGRTEGFFELDLHLYDIAAGVVILQEAGGQVTGWPGQPSFLETGNVLASNGLLHTWLQQQIGTYFI